MDGKCLESGIVYQATVAREGMGKTETYVGLTATTFKQRYANHKHTFTNKELSNATQLSQYVHELEKKRIGYNIKWKILAKAKPYSNVTKRCDLCIMEKYFIMFHPEMATLNQRAGVITSCLHAGKYTLARHPT